MSFLTDILGRAEKLSSVNYQDDFNHAILSKQTTSNGKTPFMGGSCDNDLNSIFRASESLWNKTGASSAKKDFLFGDKGVVFGVSAPELGSTVNEKGDDEEREEIDQDSRRLLLASERAFFNHVLLSKPQPSLQSSKSSTIQNDTEEFIRPPIGSCANRRELLFGDKVRKYIRSGKKKHIGELLHSVNIDSSSDGVLSEIWSEAIAMVNKKRSNDRDDVLTCQQLIGDACEFLQKQYVQHMTEKVERNMEIAERGGVPGTRGLVEAFLKISPDDPDAEDGVDNGLPVWEITYHCFRAGDIKAASNALKHLMSFPQSACLVQALNHLASNEKLESDLKKKVRVEWRHNMNTTRDRYKRGLYAVVLGTDSPLADSLENWLWFQLITLHIDPHVTTTLFAEVQKAISIDYGEAHFMQSGEYHFYFMVLWLSGQFEKAIELLYNNNQLLEAVHLAILANEMGYIRHSDNSSTPLVEADPAHPTICFLNFPRLIVTFTKEFELNDPTRAMDYFFLTKGFKTPSGSDVFEKAVSRSVYLANSREEVDAIVGTFDVSGKRIPGLIDDYVEDVSEIIETVAHDSETSGNMFDALRFYLLGEQYTKAVNLLSSEISTALRCCHEDLETINTVAVDYGQLLARADAMSYAELSTLVDLIRIFLACRSGDATLAYKYSAELNILPTEPESVALVVGQFHLVPQKVREVIPDFCLMMMKTMVSSLHERRNEKFLKQVKAIVLYAATISFKFPQIISSQLLKLQASVMH